tara:strand:- start:2666 stop:2896 length:231 start_codon:yes stop_codon:yes gene_type:complete
MENLTLTCDTQNKDVIIDIILKYTSTSFCVLKSVSVLGNKTKILMSGCSQHDIKNLKDIEMEESDYFSLLSNLQFN